MNAIAYLPAPQTEATPAPVNVIPSATVTRSSLVAAIVAAAAIVPRRFDPPILTNVLIRSCGDGLEIVGTDLDVTLRAVVPGEVSPGFAITAPAHGLRDLLKASKADDVTLTDIQPGRVLVAMGGATATLQTLPPDDFPGLPSFKTPQRAETDSEATPAPIVANFPLDAKELARTLAYVCPAISFEETRHYLNGAFVHFRTHDVMGLRGLCFTATDGHRLHMRSVPALVPTNLPPVIVPRVTLKHVAKMLGKRPAGSVRITVKSSLIRFTMPDGMEVYSKLIEGTFPDYERVIPRNNPHRIEVAAKTMAAATEQVAAVSLEKARAVRYTLEGGKMAAEVNSPDSGTSRADIAATVPVECSMNVGFNASYVADVLANIDGEAHWHIADPHSPAVITSPSDPRGLMVLMPMRV